MTDSETTPSGCHQYALTIDINASRERVWKAIFEETNDWWLPDFHIAGPDSVVTFDAKPGGRGLMEETPTGAWLLWYSVQMYLPEQFKVYLIGHLAPQWGGPSTSSLELSLLESESGCVFRLVEARHGKIDQQSIASTESGWVQLFTDGLKHWVENNV